MRSSSSMPGRPVCSRVAITGFASERVRKFFDSPEEPRPAKEVLPELLAEHDPQTIALSIDGRRGVTRSLTKSSYEWLSEIMGDDATGSIRQRRAVDRGVPRHPDPGRVRALPATRSRLTEELGRRAFSNEVVEPGMTTVGDVRNWLMDQYWRTACSPGFRPTSGCSGRVSKCRHRGGFSRWRPTAW